MEKRLAWLAGFVLLWGAAIFAKLTALQILHHNEYARKARQRQERVVSLDPPRGAILDRTGQELADSIRSYSVSVNPLKVPDLKVDSEILAKELSLDPNALYESMRKARERRRGFFWVKRNVTTEEAADLRALGWPWIDVHDENQRRYPKGTLAAHLLGGVNFEESGNAGIEKALESELKGEAGNARQLADVKGRAIEETVEREPRSGSTITLTIDERLQFAAEREIAAAVQAHGAASGSVVVMNPNDGQILALASYPTFDPNEPPDDVDDPSRANHAVSVPFEPGSVFKVITLSAALETTDLRPDSFINCHGGVLTLFGRTIHDSHGGIGVVPMKEVLARSSNIGAIEIGMRVGRERMYDYVRKFGFGQKTGLPLPGEARGRLRKLPQWGSTSLASVSMGQEVSVTTVQLAQAAAVVANGGLLVKPRLLLKKDGRTIPESSRPERVILPETAITMRQMMEGVVLNGTGKEARLEGYTTGGKTGSAQIYDYATKRYTHTYNGSFMGFAPLNNPAIVVVVTLNGTHGTAGFGGAAAAPVFRAVATEALRILDVPKDLPENAGKAPAISTETADDLADASLSEGRNILEDRDEDDGKDAAEAPAAHGPGTVTVPNFKGMTLRAVLAEAAARGLTVQPDGSGVARVQTPAAGAALRQGERIRVQFAR